MPRGRHIAAELRDECLNQEIFFSLKEAQIVIEQWRNQYNTIRPHSSIGYRPPAPQTGFRNPAFVPSDLQGLAWAVRASSRLSGVLPCPLTGRGVARRNDSGIDRGQRLPAHPPQASGDRAQPAHSAGGPTAQLGKYFLVVGKQVTPKVNLEELARELACMEPWETLERGERE